MEQNTNALIVHSDDPHRTCESDDLNLLTDSGWVLVAVLEHDVVHQAVELVTNPHPKEPTDYAYQATVQEQRSIKLRSQRFLLRKGKDSILAEKDEKIREVEHQLWELKSDKKSAVRERDEAVKNLERTQADLERYKGKYSEAYDEKEELLRRIRKMEDDMARVRQDVGARRWKEIMEDGT